MLTPPGSAQAQDPKKFWYGNQYDQVTSAQNIKESSLNDLNADNWQQFLLTRAKNGDDAALDNLLNYWMSEASLQSAREYETKMNSQRYQTMIEDAKKAGINPYWVSSLGSVPSYNSGAVSYSSQAYGSAQQRSETYRHNNMTEILKLVSAVLTLGISAIGSFASGA